MKSKFEIGDHVFVKFNVEENKPYTITNKYLNRMYNAIYQLNDKNEIWFKEKDLILIGNKYNLNNLSKNDLSILDYCVFTKSREVNFISKKLIKKIHKLYRLAIDEEND